MRTHPAIRRRGASGPRPPPWRGPAGNRTHGARGRPRGPSPRRRAWGTRVPNPRSPPASWARCPRPSRRVAGSGRPRRACRRGKGPSGKRASFRDSGFRETRPRGVVVAVEVDGIHGVGGGLEGITAFEHEGERAGKVLGLELRVRGLLPRRMVGAVAAQG